MMFAPEPPPKLDPHIMKALAEEEQRGIRRDFTSYMPATIKIIGLLVILAFIAMLILMNVFHLF